MDIDAAARLIRAGELVAFPTETVYGLGANALDAAAVGRIFEAKGRPATSPLIVHVDSAEMARRVVSEWPAAAELLGRRFWPGPLTLVLPKHPDIPARVTAGLDTVGVRVPAHPVALALIQAAGVPIAAPSANRFTELSPTTAEHVGRSLGDRVAMILDGGPSQIGIESTVLSLEGGNALLLRPGMVSQTEIESVIGPLHGLHSAGAGAHASPGMHPKHYSPHTRLLLVEPFAELPSGGGACLWRTQPFECRLAVRMPQDPDAYAAMLYSTLHDLDLQGFDWIAVERPPSGGRWAAVHDRLRRAAHRA
jgi:L-threonylcarbamoyladenylate synthase